MAGETVQSSAAAYTAWLEREIIQEVRPAMCAAPLVWNKDISGYPTLADKFVLLPTTADVAGAISDGTAMSNTAVTPATAVTITAAGVGIGTVVTDFSAAGSLLDEGTVKSYLGRAVMEKLETDITATFTNFSTNTTAGTSGQPLLIGDVLQAVEQLQAAKAPGDYVAILHTVQAHHLRKAIIQTAGAIFANSNQDVVAGGVNAASKSAYVTKFLGVDYYQSPTCAASSSDKIGLMFVKNDGNGVGGALGLVMKWPLKLETLRSPMYPGVVVAATACYGTALLRGAFGNKIITSGTA